MSGPGLPQVPSAEAVRTLLHVLAQGVRHDYGLVDAMRQQPWPVWDVLERAEELGLVRRLHLTDAGRVLLGTPSHWRERKALDEAPGSANGQTDNRCCCGSCAITGLYATSAPYYPVSLREGR